MSIKVSVIVPVYNVEKYLEKCLNSLVTQTLKDIEIIVVNDGSPDKSQDIIDTFAGMYPDKIVALQQENKGLGEARNFGTRHARGDYIGYVDSDDWASPEMFERLYRTAVKESSDVAICDYYDVPDGDESNIIAQRVWPDDRDVPCSLTEIIKASSYRPAAWNKLYRKRFVTETPFMPGVWYEDLATIPIILTKCENISYLPEPLYYYLKRSDSITWHQNDKKTLDVIKVWQRCLNECNEQYIKEMEYAIYNSVSRFINFRIEHLDDFFLFFWKYEERFKHNEYICDEILNGKLTDLFIFLDKTGSSGKDLNPYAQNIADFLNDTTPLIEQLDKLDQATLSELCELYRYAVHSATENHAQAGPKLLVQLTDRYERILKMNTTSLTSI